MKILIACEFSGIVRESFKARGHYAVSCDLLPTEIPGDHYQGDVFDIIDDDWDLMIAHPPCTYLSYAANHVWFKPGRSENREAAKDFFFKLYFSNVPRIAIENPVGYMNTVFRQPDQVVHPYFFGDDYMKKTCLWLKNLPLLSYDKTIIKKPEPIYYKDGKAVNWCESVTGTKEKERWKIRAKTFPGIAKAMAEQWGYLSGTQINFLSYNYGIR